MSIKNARSCYSGVFHRPRSLSLYLFRVGKGTKKSRNVQGKAEKLSLFRQISIYFPYLCRRVKKVFTFYTYLMNEYRYDIIEQRLRQLEKRVEDTRSDRTVIFLSIALIIHIIATWIL